MSSSTEVESNSNTSRRRLAQGLTLIAICAFALAFLVTIQKQNPSTSSPPRFVRRQLQDAQVSSAFPAKKGIGLVLPDEPRKRPDGSSDFVTWQEHIKMITKLKASWNYSWGLQQHEEQPVSSAFMPMVFGGWGRVESLKAKILDSTSTGNFRALLGFNEPAHKDRMEVDDVLKYWPALMAADLPLVSPSETDGYAEYMEEFMTKAAELDYRIDYYGYHWYGSTSIDHFKSKVREQYEKFGKPVVLTEFAPADWSAKTPEDNKRTPAQVLEFAKKALPWLERTDYVAGYAWFSFGCDSPQGTSSCLYDSNWELTSLGRYYASITSDNPDGDQSITIE